jgi:hypothetical protein
MRLRLKEEPKEWIKFTAVLATLLWLPGLIFWHRGMASGGAFLGWTFFLATLLVVAWIRPRWFRPVYRGGMSVSFRVGQFMGKIMLTLFFFLLLTPMGLLLRILGKDLLKLKRDAAVESYWEKARVNEEFERLF